MAGCVVKLLGVAILLSIVWVAWTWGPDQWDRVRGTGSAGEASESSRALADSVLIEYRRLVTGQAQELSLSGSALESVLLFELSAYLPEVVSSPTARIENGEARLGIGIGVSSLAFVPDIQWLRRLLPDDIRVEVVGAVASAGEGEVMIVARRAMVAGVPLPSALVARLLDSMRPDNRGELPPNALRLRLPPGIRAAYIQGDRLILTAPS